MPSPQSATAVSLVHSALQVCASQYSPLGQSTALAHALPQALKTPREQGVSDEASGSPPHAASNNRNDPNSVLRETNMRTPRRAELASRLNPTLSERRNLCPRRKTSAFTPYVCAVSGRNQFASMSNGTTFTLWSPGRERSASPIALSVASTVITRSLAESRRRRALFTSLRVTASILFV
jgi:hypothetical protein